MKKMSCAVLSKIYHGLLVFSQMTYSRIPGRIRKVNAKVISVGNITWGGTGKTPLVVKLSRDLLDMGKKVAVLTRGYGNDEVKLLQEKLPGVPVLVGRDRIERAKEALKKHEVDFLILDDGFQHIRLHRDLDIVNINATEPFGSGKLFPAGILREPLEHLKRAHIFVLSKSNIGSKNLPSIKEKLRSIKKDAKIFEAVHRPVQFVDIQRNRATTLEELRGRRVATLCGIADPLSFEKTLESLGAHIELSARYDDHYEFTLKDLKEFLTKAKDLNIHDIVTTRKDYYRLEPLIKKHSLSELETINPWVLEIEFDILDEADFIESCLSA